MILDGTKCQTRRLVKESEFAGGWSNLETFTGETQKVTTVYGSKNTIKWQVGQDYAVQLKGSRGLWCCPICKKIFRKKNENRNPFLCDDESCHDNFSFEQRRLIPLRFEITGIRKERLLDISEEDAKKEGFELDNDKYSARENFFTAFTKANWKTIPAKFKEYRVNSIKKLGKQANLYKWNPEVWVLDFEVMK